MNEIVKFLIRRSRRPVAFPWAFPPQTCPMAKSHRASFLRMRRNRRSNRQSHEKAARRNARAASFVGMISQNCCGTCAEKAPDRGN